MDRRPVLRAELSGYPAVFASSTAAIDLGIPGQPDARFALVPRGSNGSALFSSHAPLDTDPRLMASRRQDRAVLLAPGHSYYVLVQAEHAVAPQELDVYGEVGYSRAAQRFTAPDAIDPLQLGLTDPRNPFRRGNAPGFGRSVSYYFDPVDLPDGRFSQSRDGFRAVLGVRATPTRFWHWSLDSFVDFSRTKSSVRYSYGASLNDLLRAWTPANEATQAAIYDPLADHQTTPVNPERRERYLARQTRLQFRSTMIGTELRLGGGVGRTPAGPVRLEDPRMRTVYVRVDWRRGIPKQRRPVG